MEVRIYPNVVFFSTGQNHYRFYRISKMWEHSYYHQEEGRWVNGETKGAVVSHKLARWKVVYGS